MQDRPKLTEIYNDQAPYHTTIGGIKRPMSFSATYTRGGIWHMERRLSIMIMLCSTKGGCDYVIKQVTENKHLHGTLKQKLIKQANTKRKYMPKGKDDEKYLEEYSHTIHERTS